MKYICLTDDYPGFTLGKVYEAEFEVHSTTIPNYNKFRTKDDQGHSRLPSCGGYRIRTCGAVTPTSLAKKHNRPL